MLTKHVVGLAVLVIGLSALTGSAAIWSWSAGNDPYIVAASGNQAIFPDNDGGQWEFVTVDGNTSPDSWAVLAATGTDYYHSASWGDVSTEAGQSGDNLALDDYWLNNGSEFGVVFVAPAYANYSVSGAVFSGTYNNRPSAGMKIGKVVAGAYSQLDALTWAGWTLGPALGTNPALQNVTLNAGDQIVFILETNQRWWLMDHDGGALGPQVENNALTIASSPVPEPVSLLLLALGAVMLRKRS